MSGQSEPSSDRRHSQQPDRETPSAPRGDSMVWSMISTLVAGPAVWGGIGFAADWFFQTGRICTALGTVVGFVTSLYLVYVKYGKQ